MANEPIKKAKNGTYYFRANLDYHPVTGKQIQKYRSGFSSKKEAKEEYSKLILTSVDDLVEEEKKEIKRRFQLWIRPSTLELADTLYKKDNCDSKSEFIEKAVLFYAGYLSAEDNKTYLPNIVTSTLKSIVAESDHRQNRMIFKMAVELAVMMNVVAANNNIDPVSLERLRGECVKEVKRLNGAFSFDDAVSWQNGWEEND